MELKNNHNLSQTFANFEKRIEQDLIVIYKNTSDFKKKLLWLEKEVKSLKKNIE